MSSIDFLSEWYTNWLTEQGLPLDSADDLLYSDAVLTDSQTHFLHNFIELWDTVQNA